MRNSKNNNGRTVRAIASSKTAGGFTLVEILIVVIILGILAAIVVPQFSNASTTARTNTVQSTLQTLRSQVELFKIQHGDTPPQTVANFFSLMLATSTVGDTGTNAATTGTLGPYLQQSPINPLMSSSGASATTTDSANGWYYSVSGNTYTLRARTAGGASITTW